MHEITITEKAKVAVPTTFSESRITGLNRNRMDILHMILAEIGKETDRDEETEYLLTASAFADIKHYQDRKKAYKVLKEKGYTDDAFFNSYYQIYDSNEKQFNAKQHFFRRVKYNDGEGSISLVLDPDFKRALVDIKKAGGSTVFAALQYILPMKSIYSKRLYLMCKEFERTGRRYTEIHDFALFRTRLAVPEKYHDGMVVSRVIEQAITEINEMTDLNVEYKLEEKVGSSRSGKVITGVSFSVRKKEDAGQFVIADYIDTPKTAPQINALEDERIVYLRKKNLSDKEIASILKRADSAEITNQELFERVEYAFNADAENVVGYIIALIDTFDKPKQARKKTGFRNFTERDTDYNDLFNEN